MAKRGKACCPFYRKGYTFFTKDGTYITQSEMKLKLMVHQKAHAITSRQGEVLVLLSRSTSCSVGQIASTLGISSVAATKLLNRLELKGLIRRTPNEWDRRFSDIRLTKAGTKAASMFLSPPKKEQE